MRAASAQMLQSCDCRIFTMKITADVIRNRVEHLVKDFRKDILDARLKDLQRQLTAAGSDMERMKQLFEEYKHTQQLRNMLARQVGSDVVV